MITQSIVWGGASGVVNGGLKAYKETKIIKWTYLPQHTTKSVLKADL